jgi:hypothetical protein
MSPRCGPYLSAQVGVMTPFAASPRTTLEIVTYTQDERTRRARQDAAVRRSARRRRRHHR